MKIIILQGLPGSGKSTWALAQCANDSNVVRVNKDDIRRELRAQGWEWSPLNEKKDVLPRRDQRIEQALTAGCDVIVDDTNLLGGHIEHLTALAARHGADVEVKRFETSVDECIRRDALRVGDAHVGSDVIVRMAAMAGVL